MPTPPYDQSAHSWDVGRDHWQTIANELPIPPRHTQRDCHIPVTARIVWERDGAEDVDTIAVAYTRDAVLVQISDRRLRQRVAAWVAPGDVRRR